MKFSQSYLLLVVVTLYLTMISNHSVSGYQKFRYPAKRMLASPTGDTTLPTNTFTLDNGVFEIWYEFTSGNGTNSTNTTDSITNSTGNTTDASNSTVAVNITDLTNTTVPDLTANLTDTVGSTINATLDESNLTNLTDAAAANLTNMTDGGNGTNATDAGNTTNTTNSTSTPTYVTFAVKFNQPGEYFALGFGSMSMAGADIWAFEFVDAAVVVSDRKAFGFFTPPLDTASGGTSDVELLGYEIADTYTLVKVRRAIDTGDTNDAVIAPGSNNLLWAFANSETIGYHGDNKGTATIELVQ